MQSPIGKKVANVIQLAYHSNIPVLLDGRHGIGKSSLFHTVADTLEIGLCVRDVSLMEPPDLAGIPTVADNGCTRYAPPSFLPREGRGILLFEELNRCPRYMRVACLELLTSRRLNDYVLPTGWVPMAATNPAGEGYDVDEMDQALLSRFLRIEVVATVGEWAAWARSSGIHEKIIAFVEQSPGIFEADEPSPRSWEYASRLVKVWESEPDRDRGLLVAALAGALGDNWALALLNYLTSAAKPLSATEIMNDYRAHRATMKRWIADAKLDLVAASLETLKRHLQPQRQYDKVVKDAKQKKNVEDFLADLVPDLQRQAAAWLAERGFNQLNLRQGAPA